jgi:hypothetical protein
LRVRGYDPAAETIDRFRFDSGTIMAYPKPMEEDRTTNFMSASIRIGAQKQMWSIPERSIPVRLAGASDKYK